MELETKLREKDSLIERLEQDRRWFVGREKEEREEKENERVQREEEKVCRCSTRFNKVNNICYRKGTMVNCVF